MDRRTNELLDQYKDDGENFFLWASFFDPHPSYLVPEPWDTMYDPDEITVPSLVPGEHDKNPPHFRKTQEATPDFSMYEEPGGSGCHGFHSHVHDRAALAKDVAVYYGMISMMDKYIGAILDKLDELGLADNTVVVFTTDHGHLFGQHGMIAKGAFHYEDLIRIPWIVRWPGRERDGGPRAVGAGPRTRRSASLQAVVDLPVTSLRACGIDVPRGMAGVDQGAVWRGEAASARDHVIVENRHQPTTVHLWTLVGERYKITAYRGHDYGELFDLQEDPNEINNLWDDPGSRELKSELLLKLIHAEMGKEPLPMPRIAGA